MLISMEKLRGLLNDLWKDEPVECFLMCQACPDKCEQSEFALATFIMRQAVADKKYLPLAYAVTSTMYWCTVEELVKHYSDEPLPAKDFELPEETATTDWWLLFRNAGHGCELTYDAIAKWAVRSELDPVDYFSDDWDDPQFLAAGLTTYLMKRLWNDGKMIDLHAEEKQSLDTMIPENEILPGKTKDLPRYSIPAKTLREIVILNGETVDYIAKAVEKPIMKKDETWTHTVVFPDGIEADLKCCSASYGEGEGEPAWCEMVLFDHGCECGTCLDETFAGITGEWWIDYNDTRYYVEVRKGEYKTDCSHD